MNDSIKKTFSEEGFAVYVSSLEEYVGNTSVIDYNSIILCVSGSAVVEINMEKHNVVPETRLCIYGDSIFRLVESSPDFKVKLMAFRKALLLDASVGLETELLEDAYLNPCMKIADEREVKMLDNFLDNMMYFSQLKKYGHRQEFLFGMLRCMTIGVFATIKRQSSNNEHNTAYTSADSHFRNFIKLLADESRHQHDVGYYAERLHITPKYLNEITNKKANATAKTVISSFLIAQIKRELTFTNTPIQKIAYDFNFCDQSSLGKFFKKATGISPINYRKHKAEK
ncbi:MAG: helix-turn-helix domain-containing protein [Muribaculaceae bacterium]|jgi:AraC family transcriptional activator of pobA|nr:helix-turn-helix domain-containing protein [Muribaculaceae bacterium]